MSLTSLLREFALSREILISHATPSSSISEFVQRIKPRGTAVPLIRLGSASDGGYLIPDDLEGVSECFSPGVAAVADFEADLISRGIRCFLADHSVSGAPLTHPLIDFIPYFVGPRSEGIYVSLDDWVRSKSQAAGDLILQMDIEGAEYRTLYASSLETLLRFRIMVFEFHGLEAILHPAGHEFISAVFERLLEHFEVVHAHPNNNGRLIRYGENSIPSLLELTLVRKDRKITVPTARVTLPNALDHVNVSNRPEVRLGPDWWT